MPPYGSFRDLPTYVDLEKSARDIHAVRFLLKRPIRQKLKDLESEMDRIANVVDGFYVLLGPRHWIFHEQMSLTEIASLVDEDDPEVAERRLIAIYQDDSHLPRWITRLWGFPEMRCRQHLVEAARAHYS